MLLLQGSHFKSCWLDFDIIAYVGRQISKLEFIISKI